MRGSTHCPPRGPRGLWGAHTLPSRTTGPLCAPGGRRALTQRPRFGEMGEPRLRHGAGPSVRSGVPGRSWTRPFAPRGEWGCAASGEAADGPVSPPCSCLHGPRRALAGFWRAGGRPSQPSQRLPAPQPCPPPRPCRSRPPARGRRARGLESPQRGSASPNCPRTPSPPPGAPRGPRATICTGEGSAPGAGGRAQSRPTL